MEIDNLLKDFKCPKCGAKLKSVDIVFMQETYDRFLVDIKNRVLTVDYGDVIDSDVLRYVCGQCSTTLPDYIVDILEDFDHD